MSTERQRSSGPDPLNHRTTFVYDAEGNFISCSDPTGARTTFTYDYPAPSVAAKPVTPPVRSARAAVPLRVEVFEFRLCGSEEREQSKALSGAGPWAVAARRVQAYLSHAADAGGAAAIGGLEVQAGIRDNRLFCQVAVSDFAAADLVVVQVEVAVYLVRESPESGPRFDS